MKKISFTAASVFLSILISTTFSACSSQPDIQTNSTESSQAVSLSENEKLFVGTWKLTTDKDTVPSDEVSLYEGQTVILDIKDDKTAKMTNSKYPDDPPKEMTWKAALDRMTLTTSESETEPSSSVYYILQNDKLYPEENIPGKLYLYYVKQ